MDELRSGCRTGPAADIFDVAVIGGGVVGCAVLRELARYRLKVLLLEKAADVGEGVTKANSGVIHAGFNVPPGTLKARANAAGLKAIYRMAGELGVPHRKTGKLVVALDPSEFPRLDELREQGDRNGTPGLTFVDAAGIRSIAPGVRGLRALFSPETGIISPYELTIALAESACLNGAVVLLEAGVTSVAFRRGAFILATPKGEFAARWVVNAAGLSAGDVAALAGLPAPGIRPFRGEYLISDKEAGPVLGMPVYPVPPRDDSFLGVHITPTMEGNILLGPSSELVGDKDDTATTAAVAARLKAEAFALVPDLARFPFIHAYAGIRPKLADFVIAESPVPPALDRPLRHRVARPHRRPGHRGNGRGHRRGERGSRAPEGFRARTSRNFPIRPCRRRGTGATRLRERSLGRNGLPVRARDPGRGARRAPVPARRPDLRRDQAPDPVRDGSMPGRVLHAATWRDPRRGRPRSGRDDETRSGIGDVLWAPQIPS